jgi:hypothetical protein
MAGVIPTPAALFVDGGQACLSQTGTCFLCFELVAAT